MAHPAAAPSRAWCPAPWPATPPTAAPVRQPACALPATSNDAKNEAAIRLKRIAQPPDESCLCYAARAARFRTRCQNRCESARRLTPNRHRRLTPSSPATPLNLGAILTGVWGHGWTPKGVKQRRRNTLRARARVGKAATRGSRGRRRRCKVGRSSPHPGTAEADLRVAAAGNRIPATPRPRPGDELRLDLGRVRAARRLRRGWRS